MTDKHCLVYETLGKVSNLQVCESAPKDMMRLTGVFGVCGVKNQNNRIYDRENYAQMVESLQAVIKESGCPGELEHPNSMNINLENVSHKIEDIQMNEDGTVTGTILLLNTPKGQIAQAIVEGGLPLYISSRGAGTITNEGRVTLSTIKTYDLVGTPGFSQAKLTLKENQTLECLNESVEDGNVMYAIVEGDDLLGGDDDKKEDDKKSDDLLDGGDKDDKKDDKKSDDKKDDEKSDDEKSDKKDDEKSDDDKKDKDNKNKDNVDMKDLKEAIDKLTDKVTSLEAELHVAKESLESMEDVKPVNYAVIEKWITEEAMPKFKESLVDDLHLEIATKVDESIETISTAVQNWITEEFAPEVQNWVVEEFAPELQNWILEEYSPEIQNWITEEYSPELQGWITEEFAPEIQNWITEEFAPVVDSWINEEFAPEHMQKVEEKVNENVSAFLAENKAGRLEEIDSLLETLSDDSNSDLNKIVKEHENDEKYKGVYVVENMPAEYVPSWQMLSEERKEQIIRNSKLYDFTKQGVLESFWSTVDFTEKEQEVKVDENLDSMNTYQMNIIRQMKRMMH